MIPVSHAAADLRGALVPRLFDMHCHLGFAPDASALAAALDAQGVSAFSTTVTPEDYERALRVLAPFGNVRVGLGLHPWWIDTADQEAAEQCEALVGTTRSIGEIGLDFGAKHADTRPAQQAAFSRIVAACARQGNKVISMHAVRAAGDVLDTLERYRAADNNACIFHWFSGTSDEVQRAMKQGCYFSIGPRMLATKRGRAYAQVVPVHRLLLETDEPSAPGHTLEASVWRAQLESALAEVARLHGVSIGQLTEQVAATSAALLDYAPAAAR